MLVVLIVALGAALVPGSGASAARSGGPAGATAKRCAKTALTVTVGRREACLRTRGLDLGRRVPTAEVARRQAIDAFASRTAIRSLAGPRWARRTNRLARPARSLLQRASGGLPSAAARSARASRIARARAAAVVTTSHQPPAGHVGVGATSEGTTTANGGTQRATMTQSAFVRECPLAGGNLPGTGKAGITMTTSAPLPGRGRLRGVVSAEGSLEAKLNGHVGDDSRLRDYDLDARVDVKSRLRVLGPAGLEHQGTTPPSNVTLRMSLTGLKPGRPLSPSDFGSMRIVDPGAADVQPVGRGDVALDRNAAEQAMALLFWLKSAVDDTFKRAETRYHDDAACLSARFDPASPSLRRNEPRRVDATVVDREGGRVALTVAARAIGATVSPASDGTSGGDPASFTLAPLPTARTADLVVEGTSNRGRVWGTVTGPVEGDQVFLYAVSLSGQGGYTADFGITEEIRHHRDISGFTFTTRWRTVKVPADGAAPPASERSFNATSHDIEGAVHATGVHTTDGDSYDCDASLADPGGAGSLQFAVGAPAGGASTLTVEGLMPFGVAAGAWTCRYDGAFFDNHVPAPTGDGANDFDGQAIAPATLSAAQLDRDHFVVPLTGQALPPRCGPGGGRSHCSHVLSWQGAATFTRWGACTRAGAGYSCTATRLPPF